VPRAARCDTLVLMPTSEGSLPVAVSKREHRAARPTRPAMRRSWRAAAGLLSGALLGVALVQCVDATFADGQFLCDPTAGGEPCPPGQSCAADGRCRTPGAGVDAGPDADTDADADADVDPCVPHTCTDLYPRCGPALSDECGGELDCSNACSDAGACGAAGVPGLCGCFPLESVVGTPGRVYPIEWGMLDASWQDVDAGLLHDGVAITTPPIPAGHDTDYLVFDHFDLGIPDGGQIRGLVARVWRSTVPNVPNGCVFHTQAVHLKWGADQSPTLSMEMPPGDEWLNDPDGGDGLGSYGGDNQTWSLQGGPALVNAPDFGLRIVGECRGPTGFEDNDAYKGAARVDYAELAVYYEPACPPP
jgi:hypothetical protein